MNKKSGKEQLEKLVTNFSRNENYYRSPGYNEAQCRVDFINPFFESLCWSFDVDPNLPPRLKEIIVEFSKGDKGRPDYLFQAGSPKFYVEAKAPHEDLNNPKHIKQLKDYAWSASLPVSILTSFHEFKLFDCYNPDIDKSKIGLITPFDLRYNQYLDSFDLLYDTLSKEAVINGSIDKFIKSLYKKGRYEIKYRQTPDKVFIQHLSKFREILAKDIAKTWNESSAQGGFPTIEELNESVQRIIDRLVFLKVCFDREIEDEDFIQTLLDKNNIYKKLKEIFAGLKDQYNGLIFNYHQITDEIIKISDEAISKVIRELFYDNHYRFDVIPVEILGNVYEQFLGKTIRLTPSHNIKVEEKPEVRKAGGVYYTPKYIVDYIVENTVGEIIRSTVGGKTPKEISKIKILDPACGSGSFLLGAFQYLIDYHKEYYKNHPDEDVEDWWVDSTSALTPLLENERGTVNERRTENARGGIHLTANKKAEIVLNNLYGVDIDLQAVEVTQMSLYLKILEDENKNTTQQQREIFKKALLPYLGYNIKCGNSLIGPDFYDNQPMDLFDNSQMRKINVFDWETEFKDIFKNGGFDVVIGNPPYVVVKGGRYTQFEEDSSVIEYYKSKFCFLEQQINIFVAFVEKSNMIIRPNGFYGMIIPNTFLTNDYMFKIRRFLLNNVKINILSNEGKVFEDAGVEGLVFIYQNTKGDLSNHIMTKYIEQNYYIKQSFLKEKYLFDRFIINLDESTIKIIRKCNYNSKNLDEICEVWRGLTTGDDAEYLNKIRKTKNYKKIIRGDQIERYFYQEKELYVNYLPDKLDRARDNRIFEQKEKLVSKFVSKELSFCYDTKQHYVLNTGVVIFLKEGMNISLKYVLALLNSKLLRFYFKTIFTDFREMFPIIKSGHLEKLPIKLIDLDKDQGKKSDENIDNLVDQMFTSQKQYHKTKKESEKELLKKKIDIIDKQIDRLVYELYGLKEEEIKIVEGES